MAILFCPKCGSMMIPEKTEEKVLWKCRKCDEVAEEKSKEVLLKKKVKGKAEIPVYDIQKNKDKLSTIKAECGKCGNDRAVWWIQQTRASDEAVTKFFKCVECGHTWREYA